MSLHVVVEGSTDEPVVKKILTLACWDPDSISIENTSGKSNLDKKLVAYNEAARWSPRFVLRDLDNDSSCAGEFRGQLLPTPAPFMCFRLAVRSIESWLMADPETLANYLHISVAQITHRPDFVSHPKDELVNLARLSTKPNIRKDMVPEPGKSRRIGAGYEGRINDYSQKYWRPQVARQHSPSLHRAIAALERLRDLWSNAMQ
jgi:hypothetical protein